MGNPIMATHSKANTKDRKEGFTESEDNLSKRALFKFVVAPL